MPAVSHLASSGYANKVLKLLSRLVMTTNPRVRFPALLIFTFSFPLLFSKFLMHPLHHFVNCFVLAKSFVLLLYLFAMFLHTRHSPRICAS